MIDLILRSASGLRAAVALAIFGIGGTLLFRLSPYADLKSLLGGASLPEETITPPDRLGEVLNTLGAAGRASYFRFQLWDLLNPILIGAAAAMLLGWLLQRGRRANSNWRFLILLPFALLAADLLENLIISVSIGAFPDRALTDLALPFVTAAKFGAAIATTLAVVAVALMWLGDQLSDNP